MKALMYIQKTREYLDYVEEHINNVARAWKVVQHKCKDMTFISDDFIWDQLDRSVQAHDISKLSEDELVQYRQKFYPVSGEGARMAIGFDGAWEHHKKHNPHHWETWTTRKQHLAARYDDYTIGKELDCVHMVIDWMAMGYKFGDTAREYYETNKDKIELPEWAVKLIYEIFDRVYGARTTVGPA